MPVTLRPNADKFGQAQAVHHVFMHNSNGVSLCDKLVALLDKGRGGAIDRAKIEQARARLAEGVQLLREEMDRLYAEHKQERGY